MGLPYYSPGPPGPPPPPPPRRTPNILVAVAILGGVALLVIGGAFVWLVFLGVQESMNGASVYVPPETAEAGASASLPPIERHVPHHALSIFEGCSDGDAEVIGSGISGAIEVGAPLYNHGDFAGCFHLYDGAAADIQRKLGATCKGPRRALEVGRKRAASLDSPSAQAWAMRDAFDGLVNVLERRGR